MARTNRHVFPVLKGESEPYSANFAPKNEALSAENALFMDNSLVKQQIGLVRPQRSRGFHNLRRTQLKRLSRLLLVASTVISLIGCGSDGASNGISYKGLWTWISGSNGINEAGNYGTKCVSAASNIPGARDNAVFQRLNNAKS